MPGTAKVKARLMRISTIACPIREPVCEVLEDEERADQPEDRADAPTVSAVGRTEPERARGAGETRDEVDEQEPQRPERLLDDRARASRARAC